MKTSLSHLPDHKQRQILRVVEIIKSVVNPEKIILFGSYAKGTFVEHKYRGKDGITYEYISDYDFLVIKDIPPSERRQYRRDIYHALSGIGVAKDVLVATPDEITRYQGLLGTYIEPAIREGIVVYDQAA